jgi:hypothetical protein
MVEDPLDWRTRFDFFSKSLHVHALKSVHSPWSLGSSYSIKTSVPLIGCEPLKGLRSLTTEHFTAFSLQFETTMSGLLTDITKYTNGCSAISAGGKIGEKWNVSMHAKSPGFTEWSDGSFAVERDDIHVSVQAPSLEDMQLVTPILTVGTNLKISKNLFIIGQASSSLQSRMKLGIKFQPCNHMHAGIGFCFNDQLSVHTVEPSLYAGLHSGATLAFLGQLKLKEGLKSNFQLAFTRPVGTRKEAETETAKVVVNQPILGVRHDWVSEKTCAYLEMGIAATAESTRSFRVKFGIEVEGTKIRDPKLCFHITASEKVKS